MKIITKTYSINPHWGLAIAMTLAHPGMELSSHTESQRLSVMFDPVDEDAAASPDYAPAATLVEIRMTTFEDFTDSFTAEADKLLKGILSKGNAPCSPEQAQIIRRNFMMEKLHQDPEGFIRSLKEFNAIQKSKGRPGIASVPSTLDKV